MSSRRKSVKIEWQKPKEMLDTDLKFCFTYSSHFADVIASTNEKVM
jgi:hypothetical protein